jgi:protein involved in polysaccharide export with SLBB domain
MEQQEGTWAMIKKWVALGAIVAVGLLLAGCYRDYGPVVSTPDPVPAPIAPPHLQVGDRVTVTVYQQPDLTGVYDVTPAGVIEMPLIGNVNSVGRTTTELERDITGRLTRGNFLQEPKVTVAIVDYRPIYILGEITKPGEYPYKAGLNVLTLVTTAGGLTYRGRRDTVLIQHAGEQVWSEYPLLSSVTILPGDVVRIPERYF